MANESTILGIAELDLSPWSARGIKQTLAPIEASKQLVRGVNGRLIDVSEPQFQKYRSTLACSDQAAPAFDGVWSGMPVTVECIAEISYTTATGSAGRPAVEGSTRTEGDLTFYRPVLAMVILDWSIDVDEWGAVVGWSLNLEEDEILAST